MNIIVDEDKIDDALGKASKLLQALNNSSERIGGLNSLSSSLVNPKNRNSNAGRIKTLQAQSINEYADLKRIENETSHRGPNFQQTKQGMFSSFGRRNSSLTNKWD